MTTPNSTLPFLTEDLQIARANIQRWQDSLRDRLKTNVGITITQAQYDNWHVNNPDYLHVYWGLKSGSYQPIFYLVDSVSDENEDYTTTLYITGQRVDAAKNYLRAAGNLFRNITSPHPPFDLIANNYFNLLN
jgi:hypothetical protein